MANIAEIIIKAVDKASDVISNIASTTDTAVAATQKLSKEEKAAAEEAEKAVKAKEEAYKGAALAITGVGVAGLAVLESTRKLNADLAMTAMQMGISEDAMRNLAIQTADAGLSLEETSKVFDLLVRAGVDCEKQMAAITGEFDTLADATGSSAEVVARQMIPALTAFGIELSDAGKHADTFTWLTRETTVGLDEFSGMMRMIAPDVGKMGISLEQSVAVMAALEARGITGAAATREFRRAVTEADGDIGKFYASLGVCQTELTKYETAISNADGMTEKFAEVSQRQFGIMAHLTSAFNEAKFGISGMLAPLEGVMVAMTTVAPIIHGVYTAQQLLNSANLAAAKIKMGELKIALTTMIAKYKALASVMMVKTKVAFVLIAKKLAIVAAGLMAVIIAAAKIIAPILLVVGVLYLLEKHFGIVSKAAEFIKARLTELMAFLSGVFTVAIQALKAVFTLVFTGISGIVNFYISAWTSIFHGAIATWSTIFGGLARLAEIISSVFLEIRNRISANITQIIGIFTGFIGIFANAGRALGDAFSGGISATIDRAVSRVRDAVGQIRNLLPFSDAKEGPLRDITASGEAFMKTFAAGMKRGVEYPKIAMQPAFEKVGAAKGGQVQNITNNITQTFNVTLSKDYTFADMMRDKNTHDKLARMQRGI